MPGPIETLIELENNACISFNFEARHNIHFDNNERPLRVISNWPRNGFTYRRGGLDLTRIQAAELIYRNLNHTRATSHDTL